MIKIKKVSVSALEYNEGKIIDSFNTSDDKTKNAPSINAVENYVANEISEVEDNVYTKTETDTLLSGKSDTSHTHDDRYYTETEINTLLSQKQNTITSGTSNPSGGSDGDIYFQYSN